MLAQRAADLFDQSLLKRAVKGQQNALREIAYPQAVSYSLSHKSIP
jgi:hypothetical protein